MGSYTISNWCRILLLLWKFIVGVAYEEWFWCIDHNILACLWVMSIWYSHSVPQTRRTAHVGFRVASTLVCLAIAYYGYTLQGQGKNFFYLGLTFQHLLPILVVQFAFSGHTYNAPENVSLVS